MTVVAFAHAQQLQWENTELKFSPSPTDTQVVGYFTFTNIGKSEADIVSVKSSCGCVLPILEKRSFSAGESGKVTATFTIGARTGLHEKSILVESNNPEQPMTTLLMKVTIPQVAQLRPTRLDWSPTEAHEPKEISLKIVNGFPVKSITVGSSNPKISAKAETVKAGEEYRIIVTPSESDQPIRALLSIKTDYPPEKPKTFFASVKVDAKK